MLKNHRPKGTIFRPGPGPRTQPSHPPIVNTPRTDEALELIRRIQALAPTGASLTVRAAGYPLYRAACAIFGDWNSALTAAERPRLNSDARRVLRELRRLGSAHGRVTKRTAGSELYAAARRHFGSWANALAIAGVAPPPPDPWTPDRVLAEIHQTVGAGRSPSAALISAAQRQYGSWAAAKAAAGMVVAHHRQWSHEAVAAEIRQLVAAEGPTPARNAPAVLRAAAQRWYGSWANACANAGVSAPPDRAPRAPEAIAQDLLQIVVAVGRPTLRRRDAPPALVREAVLVFGSWEGACARAGAMPARSRRLR